MEKNGGLGHSPNAEVYRTAPWIINRSRPHDGCYLCRCLRGGPVRRAGNHVKQRFLTNLLYQKSRPLFLTCFRLSITTFTRVLIPERMTNLIKHFSARVRYLPLEPKRSAPINDRHRVNPRAATVI
jgi:hypothetical protein